MVASMLRAQRRDPAKAQAKCAFATNYKLANRQMRSPLILRYRMQRDKPYRTIGMKPAPSTGTPGRKHNPGIRGSARALRRQLTQR